MTEFNGNERTLLTERKTIFLVEERINKTIIIGAPHQAPGGVKELPCPEHRVSDENTGVIAHRLSNLLQVSAVIVCNATVDPNKDLDTDYSKKIVDWKPKFLIEIHGHGGQKINENVIEISSGSSARSAWSKRFAEVLQGYLNENDKLSGFKAVGDFDDLYFKASKTSTILHNDWISFHIELPPPLRLGVDNKLPEINGAFLSALERTIRGVCIPDEFDIKTESQSLKDLICHYDGDLLLEEIFSVMQQIRPPRIPYKPFSAFDSPLKQLSYIASLNLTSDPNKIQKKKPTPEEWESIVSQCLKAKAGYFDLFLPKEKEKNDEFSKFYRVALPVFLNYYDTGVLNYEEQEIERIERNYKNFDDVLQIKFGLTTSDFLSIYALIDQRLFELLNKPLKIFREDEEARAYFKKLKDDHVPISQIRYEGANNNIKELIELGRPAGRAILVKESFYEVYSKNKIDAFFQLLSIERRQDNTYLYYTNPNRLLLHPIQKRADGKYLVIEIKQLLYAISVNIHDFLSNEPSLRDRYFKHRGNLLQQKTAEVFEKFFEKEAFIYNEYSTAPKGNGQDLLIVNKGLALIIETKAGREPEPRRDTVKGFEQILRNFKRTIQDGYDQAYRVKDKFTFEDEVIIYGKKDELLVKLKTRKFHNVFILVVTQDTFREAQINLPELLNLNEDDDVHPLSISIDDLEIILLAMGKLRMGQAMLIRFLKMREGLQGRLVSNDEIDIWGTFLRDPQFSIPEEEGYHFKTSPYAGELFEELYRKGLGFTNEKNLEKKKDNRWKVLRPHEL